MKILTLFLSFFFALSLTAQEDIVGVFADLNKKMELTTDINSITEITYKMWSTEEDAKPDTIVKYNEEAIELYDGTINLITYQKPTIIIEESTDANGDHVMTNTTKLHDDGRFISIKTDLGDSPAAAMMNAFKEYHYDDNDRIVSIFNNGVELVRLNYDGEGQVNHFLMDAGFGKMEMTPEQIGDITRYNLGVDFSSMDDEEGGAFAQLFAEKMVKAPKEYIELRKQNNQNIYSGYKEDKETEESYKKWENTRGENSQILSEKTFDDNGNLISHFEYIYHENGKVLEKKDIKEGSSQINQFDEQGNITLEHEGFSFSRHTYDKKGNLVRTIRMTGSEGDENIIEVITRKINYKQ